MIDQPELAEYHAKAVLDCNALLAALGEVWRECDQVLRCPKRGASAGELRAVLVRLRLLASDSVRRVMTPPAQPKKHKGE